MGAEVDGGVIVGVGEGSVTTLPPPHPPTAVMTSPRTKSSQQLRALSICATHSHLSRFTRTALCAAAAPSPGGLGNHLTSLRPARGSNRIGHVGRVRAVPAGRLACCNTNGGPFCQHLARQEAAAVKRNRSQKFTPAHIWTMRTLR